jgi:predicted DNA-binding transcriptional regulator YafY
LSTRRAAPRVGRPKGKFVQLKRVDRLRTALEAHPQGVALPDLAATLHVTERSVRRYLAELGRALDIESVPIVPGGAHLWRIKASERARTVALRRTQAIAMLAFRPYAEPFRGSALFDDLDVAYRQIQQLAQRPGRVATRGEISSDAQLDGRVVALPSAVRQPAARADEIDALFQAVAERRLVVATAARPVATFEPGDRAVLAPYALAVQSGTLYLCAAYALTGAVEVFALTELGRVELTTKTFPLPLDFDPAVHDEGQFGMGVPARARAVTVEFDARAAERVRAKKVHPAQKTVVARDGRFRISFRATDLQAVAAWVLSCGSLARVVEPLELLQRVSREVDMLAKKYR